MIRNRVHHKLYIGAVLLAQNCRRACKNKRRLKAKQKQKNTELIFLIIFPPVPCDYSNYLTTNVK